MGDSLIEPFTTSRNYPIEILIRNLYVCFCRKVVFKLKEIQYYSVFLHYLNVDITRRYDGANISLKN